MIVHRIIKARIWTNWFSCNGSERNSDIKCKCSNTDMSKISFLWVLIKYNACVNTTQQKNNIPLKATPPVHSCPSITAFYSFICSLSVHVNLKLQMKCCCILWMKRTWKMLSFIYSSLWMHRMWVKNVYMFRMYRIYAKICM